MYVKPINAAAMYKDKTVKDNVSVSYGTISKKN